MLIDYSPYAALFGVLLSDVQLDNYKSNTLGFCTFLARQLILLRWTDPLPPTYSQWITEVMKHLKLEKINVHLDGKLVEINREADSPLADAHAAPNVLEENVYIDSDLPSGSFTYRLEDLAYTRSGDKGDSANIGVIARHPLYFPFLKKFLTAEVVKKYFQHLIKNDGGELPSVTRYELPGVCGLNFLLRNSLGGGGVASLNSDPQGKSYGQMLLDYRLTGLPDLMALVD